VFLPAIRNFSTGVTDLNELANWRRWPMNSTSLASACQPVNYSLSPPGGLLLRAYSQSRQSQK
jgi:hypothetical protein